jgi:RNA polymerase sigma factor (sigma-70 family)
VLRLFSTEITADDLTRTENFGWPQAGTEHPRLRLQLPLRFAGSADVKAEPPEPVAVSSARDSAFPTTHWSVVLHAGSAADPEARSALETLCRQYWYPVYSFVRRQGRAHHESEDCTQEFLARLLSAGAIGRARPERGRFRTFLLTALRNFLTDEWHRSRAAKRGGGQTMEPLELVHADVRFSEEPVALGLSPEQAFDRNWAHEVIDRALSELRAEYESTGRGALFSALAPRVWGDDVDVGVSSPTESASTKAHALTMALHRLRRRLGERLRAQVAATVADGADVDEELRQLIATLGGDRNQF